VRKNRITPNCQFPRNATANAPLNRESRNNAKSTNGGCRRGRSSRITKRTRIATPTTIPMITSGADQAWAPCWSPKMSGANPNVNVTNPAQSMPPV
jgi:hypothetical protein